MRSCRKLNFLLDLVQTEQKNKFLKKKVAKWEESLLSILLWENRLKLN